MPTKITWKEFTDSGLLWMINHLLQVFGYSIVVVVDNDTGEILEAYPAKTSWFGFDDATNKAKRSAVLAAAVEASKRL